MKDLYEELRKNPKDVCTTLLRAKVDDSTRFLISRNLSSHVWTNIMRVIRFDGSEVSDGSYIGLAIKNKTYTPLQLDLAYEKC